MAAELIEINPDNIDRRKINRVANIVREGGVIVYPTDTIYAIGCDMSNSKALHRIAQIKGVSDRKTDFSIICSDLSDLSRYAKHISNPVFKMMKQAFPGPFTFILEASNDIPRILNPGKKTIGIRVPDHPIPLMLVSVLGNPIITTSIRNDDEVLEYMTDPNQIFDKYRNEIDVVIDGGSGGNQGSTVIDASGDEIILVREGLGDADSIGLIVE